MDPMIPPPSGQNPAQIHNSLAQIVLLYGSLLDQQKKHIDLLQQQLTAALMAARKAPSQTPVAALQLDATKLEEKLKIAEEDRRKYCEKAYVYGAIAGRYQDALERVTTTGSTAVTTIVREALTWRHTFNGGPPREASEIVGELLRGPVASRLPEAP